MSLEFKTVYIDMPEKRKYWVYSEKNKTYDWIAPTLYCDNLEDINKFKQYHNTLTQCSTEKLRKIADAMGFYITGYIQEETEYHYNYEWYKYPFCCSVQGFFAEMPDITFKLLDKQYRGGKFFNSYGKESDGIEMYVLTNNGFKECNHDTNDFFGNYYNLDPDSPYHDTCFKTSFFKIVDIVGGLHIISTNNIAKTIRHACDIVNLFDTTTHNLVGYGVTMGHGENLHPVSDRDKDLETQNFYPVIYRHTDSVGTQKFITKVKDNQAWYRDVAGADTTYRVGTGVNLQTYVGNPANTTMKDGRYYVTTLSNGIKIFSANYIENPIAFKD